MKPTKANKETEMKTELTQDDILDMDAYNAVRDERRPAILETKRKRRLQVGPHVTFYFECFDTMWYQIQEMLRIEKGGEEQLADELEAYSPLVPKGDELVATVMFEIPDADLRARTLGGLGGVEETITLDIGDDTIAAEAEQDVDRTSAAGKASSVQFVHFKLTPAQIDAFKSPGTRVMVGINHSNYGHMAILSDELKEELARDLAG
jgi:hypothetical protein